MDARQDGLVSRLPSNEGEVGVGLLEPAAKMG